MNIRDFAEFDPSQVAYIGAVTGFFDECCASDTDSAKRGYITSRLANLVDGTFRIISCYAALVGVDELGYMPLATGYLATAYAVSHVGLALFNAYEGKGAGAAKEAATAGITLIGTPVYAFAECGIFFVDLAGGLVPMVGRFGRGLENGFMNWSQRQINAIEGGNKSYERKWSLQTRGDLFAEGMGAFVVNSALHPLSLVQEGLRRVGSGLRLLLT